MTPAPPALFSTIIVWPSVAVILSAIMRPMMSVGPAGANGTTSRTVRSGYLSWARASDGAASAPAPTANRWRRFIS